jgi:glycosyltransferase involved in cell wall biosynthesis
MKIVLLTEIPAPYRIPLFNALAAIDDVDLKVLFLRRNDPRRNYPLYEPEMRFDWDVLRGRDVVASARWVVANLGTRRTLRRLDPDLVVTGGWNQPAYWSALTLRKPTVVWVESTARDARRGRGPAEWTKRLAVRRAAAFLVPGSASRDYLRGLGVSPELITVAPNAADVEIFAAVRDRQRSNERCTFVCVSRFSPEKGVDVLARAAEGVDAEVVLVGDGPDERRIRELAPANVTFTGHVERDRLPDVYARADAFVMPSRSETWGIAMNEAAAAGLPLIATEAPGAAYDLIEDGVNGFRVPVDDVGALRSALVRVAADPDWRAKARARTVELSQAHTPEAWATAVAGLAQRLQARARLGA